MEGKEGATARKEGTSDMDAGRLCCAFEPLVIEGKWILESVEGTIKDDISLKGGLVWIDWGGGGEQRRATPLAVSSPRHALVLACHPRCDQSPFGSKYCMIVAQLPPQAAGSRQLIALSHSVTQSGGWWCGGVLDAE